MPEKAGELVCGPDHGRPGRLCGVLSLAQELRAPEALSRIMYCFV